MRAPWELGAIAESPSRHRAILAPWWVLHPMDPGLDFPQATAATSVLEPDWSEPESSAFSKLAWHRKNARF